MEINDPSVEVFDIITRLLSSPLPREAHQGWHDDFRGMDPGEPQGSDAAT